MKKNFLLLTLVLYFVACKQDGSTKSESNAKISIATTETTDSVATTNTPESQTDNSVSSDERVKKIGDDYCDCFTKSAEGINLAEIKLSEISNSKFQKQMEGFGKNMENCAGKLQSKYGTIDKNTQTQINKYLQDNCKTMKDLMQFLEPEMK